MFRFRSRMTPANDNTPPRARMVPLIGVVGAGGRINLSTFAHALRRLFPNDHREA